MDATITFKDSLCFLPMPLADLPETFNLVELHKGWFLHAFQTIENLTYIGSIPAKQYFQPQVMKKQKREEFDTWYAAELERNDEYVIPEDMIVIEPLNVWRGANVNQSKAALEWLCYEDFKLGENRRRPQHQKRNSSERNGGVKLA